jgi:hypothetical protein
VAGVTEVSRVGGVGGWAVAGAGVNRVAGVTGVSRVGGAGGWAVAGAVVNRVAGVTRVGGVGVRLWQGLEWVEWVECNRRT